MPTVDFDLPDDPNGVIARAHVVCADPYPTCQAPNNPDGTPGLVAVASVVVDDPGSGYSRAPNVVIRDGTQFQPLNARAFKAAQAARQKALKSPQAGPLSPQGIAPAATTPALATATLAIQSVTVNTFGAGYTSVPSVSHRWIGSPGIGSGAMATAVTDVGTVTAINLTAGGSGYLSTGGIKKFLDGLPGLCDPSVAGCTAATTWGSTSRSPCPTSTTFPDADYYVIALVQHREQMNSSLPATGTLLREYVQLETADNASWSKHVALQNDLLTGSTPALMPDGSQAVRRRRPALPGANHFGNQGQAGAGRLLQPAAYRLRRRPVHPRGFHLHGRRHGSDGHDGPGR